VAEDTFFQIDSVDRSGDLFKQESRKKKKGKKKPEISEDEAKEHFDELSQVAEQVHELLLSKNLPYRFCIYKEDNEIFFDLVVIDDKGTPQKTVKKNITHQEFSELIKNIENLDGLFMDFTV